MRRLLALSVALVLSGCFQSATVMTVRPDGSATIRDEITLSGMALIAIAEETAGSDDALFGEEQTAARLSTLGDGVRLESFEAREDGYTAVYAVDDVREITLGPPSSGAADATGGLAVTFGFDPGDPSVLRVVVPKPERGKPSPPSDDADSADEDAEALRMLGMMRSMFSEAQLSVAVEVEGEVVDSSAPTLDGTRLTVLDFSFDALLDAMEENPELAAATNDPMAQMDQIREIEGVEMLRPGTVRVRFR